MINKDYTPIFSSCPSFQTVEVTHVRGENNASGGSHTFEGVEGVLEIDSVSLDGCNLPFAESNGVDGAAETAGIAGLAGGRLVVGVLGVAGVCGGGPT